MAETKTVHIELTEREAEILLGVIANATPLDKEVEISLYELYFKIRLEIPKRDG